MADEVQKAELGFATIRRCQAEAVAVEPLVSGSRFETSEVEPLVASEVEPMLASEAEPLVTG